jgi:hypothetical protein
MSHIAALAVVTVFAFAPAASAQTSNAPESSSQWKAVQDAMGRPGKMQPHGAWKLNQ